MSNSASPPLVAGLSALAGQYRFLLCDVWGVVHNGAEALHDASVALSHFREGGGTVLLITNAPRPKQQVTDQLDQFGVPAGAYDDVVTSGEASREFLATRPGVKIFHVGPKRDLPLYAGLDLTVTGEDEADLIACTGLFDDETESPEDYDPSLRRWLDRRVPMLCVNPDRVVERGPRLIWCAGAIADRYAAIGGETIIIGKPHRPIYQTAFHRLAAISKGSFDVAKLLAIGDGVETDLRGANGMAIDALFITGGIHAADLGDRDRPDAGAVHAFLERAGLMAAGYMPKLVW